MVYYRPVECVTELKMDDYMQYFSHNLKHTCLCTGLFILEINAQPPICMHEG